MTEPPEPQEYDISTDKARLNPDLIHDYLSNRSYWARGRSHEATKKSLEHSLCFGLYVGDQQVGFARVVTDYATFAWLCDVFVLESHRGRGFGKALVACAAAHPELRDLKLFLLATRDAHEMYRQHGGFRALPEPEKWMVRST